jgi:hypothetical protein
MSMNFSPHSQTFKNSKGRITMANGKPIVRPGSDGILEIQVGERTVEVKPEYLDTFVFEVEMSQEFISKIKTSIEAISGAKGEESPFPKHELKATAEAESAKILFTRVDAAQGGK